MSVAAIKSTREQRWLPLRFALREMRGGLRGFYVFIACIALGVHGDRRRRLAGRSLADGLAREGQVILGGDLVVHADPARGRRRPSALSCKSHGTVSARRRCAPWRAPADGQATLVEIKAVDGAYPLYGTVALDPPGAARRRARRARRRLRRRRRPDAAGAARSQAGRTAHHRQRNIRNPRRAHQRARQARRRHRLRPAPAGERGGLARHRPAAARQPGALALSPAAAATTPATPPRKRWRRAARAQLPEAGWDIRTRNNASPQLERNVERFTQFLTIVGLTALLVGGVGVGNAVKSHLDRRRDIIATLKALGARGAPRLRHLSHRRCMLLALIGGAIGVVLGAALPFAIVVDASAPSFRCRSCRRCIRANWRWRWSTAC